MIDPVFELLGNNAPNEPDNIAKFISKLPESIFSLNLALLKFKI